VVRAGKLLLRTCSKERICEGLIEYQFSGSSGQICVPSHTVISAVLFSEFVLHQTNIRKQVEHRFTIASMVMLENDWRILERANL